MVRPVPAGIARNWPIRSVFFLVRNRGVICTGLLADTVYSGRAGRYDTELTPLVSKLLFVKFFIQCFKTIICFIWFNILRFFLSFPYKYLFAFLFTIFHFYSFIYICPQPFMPSHLKYTQTKNDVIYLQPFNNTQQLHNSNIVVPFDSDFYEYTRTKEEGLRIFFIFSDGGLRF